MEDQARQVSIGEELNIENLQKSFKLNILGFTKILEIQQFPGGFSNLTYLVLTDEKKYVLRKPPKGANTIKGGHNMKREYSILCSLKEAGFAKIPNPIFFSSDEEIIGSEFYVMEKLEGTILRNSQIKNQMPFIYPELMQSLSRELCKTQAELHKIEIINSPLQQIGKPKGYIERQVLGWYERYKNSETDDIIDLEKVIEWLKANIPNETKPALIHNDFKFDNVIFDLKTQKILAILDWEMTTVGDPRMDIGTTLSYWAEAGDGDFEKNFNLTWLPGSLTRNEYVELYKSLNPSIDLSNILYFYIFGLFKNAVIIQQIFSRFKKGLTMDPRFANLGFGVKSLIKKAANSIDHKKML